MVKENPTIFHLAKGWFGNKKLSNGDFTTKKSITVMKKQFMTENKIPFGSSHIVDKALKEFMTENQMKIPDDIAGKSIGDNIKVRLEKNETIPPKNQASQMPQDATSPSGQQPQLTPGQLALQQQQQILLSKIVTPQQAASWEKGMKIGFRKLMFVYAKVGAIEVEDVAPAEKKMKIEDYYKETDEFAHDLADYCLRYNLHLPKHFEAFMLCISGFSTLGAPLLHLIFARGRKQEKKEKVDDIGRGGEELGHV